MVVRKGVRLVATFEAAKGLLVLSVGFGLLSLVHHDIQAWGDEVVRHFHLDPASRYPQIFLLLLDKINDRTLWLMATLAMCYAGLRLVEAYGLWLGRRWAEWLAVASSGLYVPIEIYELVVKTTWLKGMALFINLVILAYMAYVLKQSTQATHHVQ